MSYDIYIGNAIPEYPSEDNGFRFGWCVERVTHPEAPEWPCTPDKFGSVDISGKTNGRHPGYAQFADFCKEAGVEDIFDELMPEHPGIACLKFGHLRRLHNARKNYENVPLPKPAGWNDGEDPVLARLIWYEWWMKWAIANCKYPAVENY